MSSDYIEDTNVPGRRRSTPRLRRHTRMLSDPVQYIQSQRISFDDALKDLKLISKDVAGKCIQKIQHVKQASRDVADKCISSGYRLLSHAELPEWLKDNEFLQHFHRPHFLSVKACFQSILSIHTETGNIWTHLVGQIMFLLAIINFYFATPGYYPIYIPKILRGFLFWLPSFWSMSYSQNKYCDPLKKLENSDIDDLEQYQYMGMILSDHIVIGSFFLGATSCLLFSWLFHTLYCHSPRAMQIFIRMDYAGICSLITTSSYPIIFYAFKNQRYLMVTYLSMISFFGILCIIVTSIEKFAAIDYRCHRAILFTLFGFINIVPFSHFVSLYGCSAVYHIYGGKYVLLSATFYLSGVFIYAKRIPEKMFPQFFNIWFHSHQILHVCVVAGLFSHFRSIFTLLNINIDLRKAL